METIESIAINTWLKTQPKVPLTDQPLFRLVWSDEQFEIRTGEFEVYADNLFIGYQTKTIRTLRYNWIKERWLLEAWFPPELVLNPELPESNKGSYECMYVFEDSKGNSLPLNLKVVELIVYRMMNKRGEQARKSAIAQEFEDKDVVEDKYFEDVLDTPNFYKGSDIIVPANYPVQSPNLRSKQ
jgi:hypothetical protein